MRLKTKNAYELTHFGDEGIFVTTKILAKSAQHVIDFMHKYWPEETIVSCDYLYSINLLKFEEGDARAR